MENQDMKIKIWKRNMEKFFSFLTFRLFFIKTKIEDLNKNYDNFIHLCEIRNI